MDFDTGLTDPNKMIELWELSQEATNAHESHILYNAIRTPDGTVLCSRYRHDYRVYEDKNGLEYMIDGGLDYLRRNVNKEAPYEELSVTTDATFELQRTSFAWGSFGKTGEEKLHYIPLCEMTNEHINAILDNGYGAKWVRDLFELELKYRNIKNIND